MAPKFTVPALAGMKPRLFMVNPRRYVWVVLLLLLGLHYILRISHESYARTTSLSRLVEQLSLNRTILTDAYYDGHRRANATFVFLCRNSDIAGVVSSIQQMEDRFNRKHQYPWVLLNDEPFTDDFKKRVSALTDAPIHFGTIPKEHWVQPDWIDEKKAGAARKVMVWQRIIYGGSVPYRNMCRFNSGFFYRHELLLPYKYYWRVEPDVKFFCDIDYDPFLFMQDKNKTYALGFTITMEEFRETITTLWDTTKEFMVENPQYVAEDNALGFLSNDGGISYNLCHYWSNFEIADMDFWRGEAYSKYFDFLESKGGFYYERWGDAPVHSIAASLFLSKHQLHFFRDIGYRHEPFQHCPQGDDWSRGRCACNPDDNFDYTPASCIKNFDRIF
ncbi:glycosyltransferase family 15 protein [Neolentinus lepideus HHB14362 ss-1]|uniref:Glycosyltransferase family 15 protein n=1 Tax=Neolentinus lepideus HHB14362 ss-1 TaxID=1314782 RepID=A0A165TC68_9AGAM|nr:glycosyltransferase family 15 protein [Neolentinus lepideus HHB14362 ss-1]